ncbi:SusC/RagA family TonB-linked outer membrane protein [Pararcticibacter amylolyticus]|uniref:SusC/RagA family protein n=1 Tax=Pararcticibacter amylolyticus TaxID=2173175 RepID=A0A2U2PG51_9SPHI|nr:SusC/RagA family TonB-linked outer membrane protein [Pararcticibacter amylolyticus]PWG80242.1 SusC/RagA family protein [Pararcticibacter amylolyticus]
MNENVYKKKKRMLLLLLLATAMVFSVFSLRAEVNSQHGTPVGQKLGDFIKSLEKQYQVSFVYDAAQINKESIIEADKNTAPLDKALNQLLSNGITYKIIDNKVILKKAVASSAVKKQGDDIVVKGTVHVRTKAGTDATPGIYVLEKGTKNGTATGMNGEYSLRVKEGATLVFSMIGFKSQEVPVNGRTAINVTLEEDVNALEEVVVNGYQSIPRKLFTGSAVTLKGSDVKQEGITDVSRMLQGRAAGVSVQNVSGTFGAAPKIRIRGATSITGDNKPLWVVDGVILEDVVNVSNEQLSTGDATTLIGSSVAGLNAEDIESFQILKDASATSLYGARAMNGVIVVTTKKGKIGKPVVAYTGNFSTYLKPSYDNFNIMNSADQMAVYMEMENKGWLLASETSRKADGGIFTKLNDLYNQYEQSNGQFGLPKTAEARNTFLTRYAQANTDWFDVLFRNSLLQEHSFSVSSGSEKSQLYVSTSYLHDNGWTIGDNVKRYTGNMRANFDLSKKISLGFITQGSIRDQQAPGTVGRNSNPVEGRYDRDFDINPFSYALNTSRTLTAYDGNGDLEYFRRNFAPFNIINELDNNTLDLSMIDLKLQGEGTYKIIPSLKYTALGALRYAKTNREHKVKEKANMSEAYRAAGDATVRERNRFLYRDPDNPDAEPVVILPYGGFYNTNDDYLISYNFRHQLEWDKTIRKDHILHALATHEIRYADRQNKFNNGYGYQFDKGGVPYIDPRVIKRDVEGNFNYYGMEWNYDRFIAYAVNGAYSYKGKYNFNGTVRYDGSNLLGRARTARWLPTWNVSGAWNADTEDFMKKQSVINRATLRASYGLTASMGNATNSSLVLRSGSTLRPYLSEVESRITIDNLENSELTWEKSYDLNVGIDLGFLNERFTLTVDGYRRDGFDLISPIRTSAIGGEYQKNANYADMRSHGIELTLGAGVIQNTDLKWRTNLTFAYNKNKITNLRVSENIWSLIEPDGGPMEGHPYRGLFSLDFQGLNPENGLPQFINENGEKSSDVYLQDDETSYLKYEGSVDPTISGGFYNSLSWKNLSLSALFTYSAGNKIRLSPMFNNSYQDVNTSFTDLDAMPKEFINRWVLPGDEGGTNIPSIIDTRTMAGLYGIYPYNSYNYSSVRVADGGYVRLKQVVLSYNFPSKVLKTIGLNSVALSGIANNVWLIYSDKKLNGMDPEFFGSGGVALPIPRQFTLSLKVGI